MRSCYCCDHKKLLILQFCNGILVLSSLQSSNFTSKSVFVLFAIDELQYSTALKIQATRSSVRVRASLPKNSRTLFGGFYVGEGGNKGRITFKNQGAAHKICL